MAQQQFGTTSFIPKKPTTPVAQRRRGTVINVFFLIALIIFLGTVSVAVGVFLYQKVVTQNLEEKGNQLVEARAAFEPALIEDLATMDNRIQAAQEVLHGHLALSAFFELLEQSTLKSVQFDNFTYTATPDGRISIGMKGRGQSFSSVALQSDIFGKDPFIQNPLFSNLDIDEQGHVIFDFAAALDPILVSYRSLTDPLTKQQLHTDTTTQ